MTDDTASGPYEWTEVHIVPAAGSPKERLLLQLVDPLIHNRLAGRVESWHYFWEPELLLRIRWQRQGNAEGQAELRAALEEARSAGELVSWEFRPYPEEAPEYGHEIWDDTFHDWMWGSEFALAIIRFESEGRLSRPRPYHWNRRIHIFSNQLGLDWFGEGLLSLNQAFGYFDLAVGPEENLPPDRRRIARETVAEIERILRQIEASLQAIQGQN